MIKLFKDNLSKSKEEARFIGVWPDGSNAFESTTIYMNHLVRLEKGRKISFVYDPGKTNRMLKIPNYRLI
jgi:hypothetical protein